ncbi:MAG: hypothetical protein JSW40_00575 [Candidatus Omnitrophota bacterium]|nr:MAG: hypothetical protein JSW40_00575 [Candidatus Omnitrophota bacterium]
MTKAIAVFLISAVLIGFASYCYGSDWDKVGKIFAGIEGLRILTGGNVDVVGTFTGINNNDRYIVRRSKHHHHTYGRGGSCRRIWAPRFTWKKRWIPTHKEYDEELGEIIVEGHYIKYKINNGGYWTYECH